MTMSATEWRAPSMKRLQTVAEGISRVGAIVGGALLLLASVLICIDITMRYLCRWTLGGADELSGYALAIASAWGFSAALLSRSHIRIDTVYVRVQATACGRCSTSSAWPCFAVLLRAGHLVRLGRRLRSPGCPARARCRRSRRRWSSRRACGSPAWRSSLRLRCCCWRAALLAFLRGDLRSAVRADRLEVGRRRGRGGDPATSSRPSSRSSKQ